MKKKTMTWFLTAMLTVGMIGGANASIMSLGDVTDNGGGSYTIRNGTGSVPDATLETWLGLLSGTLDGMASTSATEGSAIQLTAPMAAGDTLSFDWVWGSEEWSSQQTFNDYSFYSLTFIGATQITDTYTVSGTSGTISWTAPTAGTMTLGIGVVDVGDTILDSWLNVSNIVIPEPATFSLIGVIAVGLTFVRRRFSM